MSIHSDPIVGRHDSREPPTRRCGAHSRLRPSGSAIRRALVDVDGPLVLLGPSCADYGVRSTGEIVVCLDGSAQSTAVLESARDMARRMDGRVFLVAVLTRTDAGTATTSGCDAERVLAHRLAGVAEQLADDDLSVEWDVLHGDTVADAVLAHVESRGSALIAVNSHGGDTPPAAILDPTWSTVVRRSPVPVLLSRATTPPPRRPTSSAPFPKRPRPPVPEAIRDGRLPARRALRSAPTGRRRSLRSHWPAALVSALTLLVLLTVPTPYLSQRGALRPVEVRIDATTPRQPSGRLLYPVVVTERTGVLDALGGWLDPDVDVHPRATLSAAAVARSMDEMATAKRSATDAALDAVATRVGWHAISDHDADSIVLDTGSTIGPSAGLAQALGIVDLLTPRGLLRDRTVVATGEIHADGTVLAVRGIRMKTLAARTAGADLLLVPCPNLAEATASAGLMTVACVVSLQDAVEVLSD